MMLSNSQRDVYGAAVREARAVAVTRKLDPAELALRVVLMEVTESNGQQLANDGKAFHPDPAKRRPGWADGWSAEKCQPIYDVLRKSLEYPHDGVGNNGGSTGAAQGLSKDYLTARFGKPTDYGWGTIDQQLDPEAGAAFVARAFLVKVQITDDPVYRFTDDDGKPRKITCAHPAVADVLRVQQPKPSEAGSENYGADRIALARAVIAEIGDPPVQGDWFTAAPSWKLLALFGTTTTNRTEEDSNG